jgi:chromosome segregation ATPase
MAEPFPPKTPQGTYILDLKAEAQRSHELTQQMTALKAKHKETTSKHKQLQRDHARLLDRKLEGDRRVGSLQQKLQQLRSSKQAGAQGGSSADAAAAGQGGVAAGFSGAAGGAVAAEQQARLAAEAKVGWLVCCN